MMMMMMIIKKTTLFLVLVTGIVLGAMHVLFHLILTHSKKKSLSVNRCFPGGSLGQDGGPGAGRGFLVPSLRLAKAC